MQPPKDLYQDAPVLKQEVLDWISKENLWNLWVPKEFGGLECSLKDGLDRLKSLARTDGSLGWTVTLCAGANFFIGNLRPKAIDEIFANKKAILGGSGAMTGTAQKEGNAYRLNGIWSYATGAPYLTHFTLNAKIVENGKELTNEDGSPRFLSFVIAADQVSIIEDWNTMGLKATATHSFEVRNVLVSEEYSFMYNQVYLSQPIYEIDFSVFADLTLWVNYLGMAGHLLEEAASETDKQKLDSLNAVIRESNEELDRLTELVESTISKGNSLDKDLIKEVHETASHSVRQMSEAIITLHPYLGVKASREDHSINQIFRDYFTATQHHIFTREAAD